MASEKPEFILDGLGPLDAGCNSGVPPQLLPKNQTAFSTNTTHRGGFAKARPPFRKMAFSIADDTVAEFKKLLFQGACFYKPDTGAESIRAQIGGRLFQFIPDASTNVAVTEWTIQNDPNPSDLNIAWLWQSELWTVVQNGSNLPIFWDTAGARRSNGPSISLGITGASFVVPDTNHAVVATLTAPYTGPLNQNITIGGAAYGLVGPHSTLDPDNAKITNVYDVAGTAHADGELFVSNPNILGVTKELIEYGNSFQPILTPHTYVHADRVSIYIKMTLDNVGIVNVGDVFLLFGKQWRVTALGTPINGTDWLTARNLEPVTIDKVNPGTVIFRSGTSYPIVTMATLSGNINAPAIGSSLDIITSPAYTGSANQVVYLGPNNAQYKITQLPSPPPSNDVLLINYGDTPGGTVNVGASLQTVPELPSGRMGTYGMGRNWLCLNDGHSFMAGDIVGGSSGSPVYSNRDAVLKSTENTFLNGGGNFVVPSAGGNIQAMRFSATLDVSLGQGPLQIFTPNSVFSCMTPTDRTLWSNLTNPILTQSLIGNGGVGQESTQLANGDILFRAIDGIRSLILARRDFGTWGNVPISREMQRVIDVDALANDLLPFASAILFDNRMLMTSLPNTGPLGVYHQGLIALNFDPVSSLRGKAPSIYDGLWTGMNVLRLVTGEFNGKQRAFAFCYNSTEGEIELWEILPTAEDNRYDNGTTPIAWGFESASLFNNVKGKGQFDLVELLDAEIYISNLSGVGTVQAFYRSDSDPCWHEWVTFSVCANGDGQYRSRLGLGSPDPEECDLNNNRPARYGNNFQVAFRFTGSFTFMGALFKARPVPETQFSVVKCDPLCDAVQSVQPCEDCVTLGTCEQFPLVFYNLNDHRQYQNVQALVYVNGQPVYIAPGTVTYNPPYDNPGPPPSDPPPPLPPLTLNCPCGGTISRNMSYGLTDDEFTALIMGMITECVNTCANNNPPQPPPSEYLNAEQTATAHCPDGTPFSFTVAAGQYSGATQQEANAKAMLYATEQANLHLMCFSDLGVSGICKDGNVIAHFTVSGINTPLTLSVQSGSLPDGLTFSQTGSFEGSLLGFATVAGDFTFTIACEDAQGVIATKEFTFSVIEIATASPLPDATLNSAYSETLTITGTPPGAVTWEVVDGALPDGLTLNPSTGEISGTPTVEGTYNFTVQVSA